ncbi:hydrogenase formation protein HypD [Candidatus Aminicenantes bacterium AC-334-K16]|jgi:hydrogenase expression/formation protein HypD|nr:hydrogenase formation protein HypD [Candidatus Aminicenantes bacterium AC-334-K16]
MNELRNREVIHSLLKIIAQKTASLPSLPVRLMEVCGTHTMSIHRHGLRPLLLEAGIEMLSGPGCPVCITPDAYHEVAIQLISTTPRVILATFGDMTRVPTRLGSLQTVVPASGSQVKIVYSPAEAIALAKANPDKEIIFFGVGFETTIPGITLAVRQAWQEKISNFSLLSALWIIPPPLRAIVASRDVNLHGFLYPGHVSAIIGVEPYRFMAEEYGLPGAITGFEPADILLSISSILDLIKEGQADVLNEYRRVVPPKGNPRALKIMAEMLEKKDAFWRGLGYIPQSGLKLKKKYQELDAEVKFSLKISPEETHPTGCRCGDVLKGKIIPPECPLFGKSCMPASPRGPCMVSFEGACLAFYKYDYRPQKEISRKKKKN